MSSGSIFYQREVWVTRDGRTLSVDAMEQGHRANLLRWIWKNRKGIRHSLAWYWAIQIGMHDGGDMAHDALESEGDFVDHASDEELFQSLPLVKRLRELTPDVSGIPT